MIDLTKIVRPNILKLNPYTSARDAFSAKDGILLDANENPFGKLNRYPDPYQSELKEKLEELKGIATKNIFVGNGSDEAIDLTFRIFCTPGKDKALIFSPTYGMYNVSAAINNVEILKVPLNSDFQIDTEKVKPYLVDRNIKLIFICSPNNPTGNLIDKNSIEYIIKKFEGIVVIDEAYIDFTKHKSSIGLVDLYNNLIVTQTLSKAWGLAGARIGLAYANEAIISLFNKVKPPYNVSTLNQNAAIQALTNLHEYEENLKNILSEKKRMKTALANLTQVKKIHSSDANFILIEVENADKLYKDLVAKKIITRNRNKEVKNSIRISIGTQAENNLLIKALKQM